MENQIQNIIQQQKVSEGFKYENKELEDVELSDEELSKLIRAAKLSKLAKLKEKEHWDKVNAPKVYNSYTTEELGKFMLKKAKAEIPGFILDDNNRFIFKLLCQYFNNDTQFESNDESFSLRKGLILFGPIGCGKTSLMRLFHNNQKNCFVLKSARQAADDYSDKDFGGANALQYYSNLIEVYSHNNYGQTHAGICFDDLGTESIKKHFGNEINAMQDVILNRYDKKIFNKTHFTTNLSSDEISDMYGSRVRSRLREMCNMIIFSKQSIDRRK